MLVAKGNKPIATYEGLKKFLNGQLERPGSTVAINNTMIKPEPIVTTNSNVAPIRKVPG